MGDFVYWGVYGSEKKWYEDTGAREDLLKAGFTKEQIAKIEEIVEKNTHDTGSDE